MTVGNDLVDHRTTDANLADVSGAIAQARNGNFQLCTPLLAHHDHTTIRRYCFEDERNNLLERFIQSNRCEQRNTYFANQSEQIALAVSSLRRRFFGKGTRAFDRLK